MSRSFQERHIGPDTTDELSMLSVLGLSSLEELIQQTVPDTIRYKSTLTLPAPLSEHEATASLEERAAKNKLTRSFIGQGYSETVLPAVIRRNIFENPGWYTQYTPYQAEIAQGRLEALLNFQTVIAELTGLEIANASLLDEPTAAAEAVMLACRVHPDRKEILLSEDLHPQTIDVVRTRAEALGLSVIEFGRDANINATAAAAVVLSYPASDGTIVDLRSLASQAKSSGALTVVCADLLMLCIASSPGSWGADVVVGNSQRFGVPLGFGGPHAAYFATKDDYKRQMPGRVVGVSRDASGKPGLRLALQTREQHIRRDRATSNICTAQVLLAVMAGMYAVYHGPDGLREIAHTLHRRTQQLAAWLAANGNTVLTKSFFDTLRVLPKSSVQTIRERAEAHGYLLRFFPDGTIGISLGESVGENELATLAAIFAESDEEAARTKPSAQKRSAIPEALQRSGEFMAQSIFHQHRSETSILRYIRRLESRDLSLTTSMIPLGSCTMKLNAASEMLPVTWPAFSTLHPYAPIDTAQGYVEVLKELESWLCSITGLDGCSLQPNAGSQGEYAGLLAVRSYLHAQGETDRKLCLIPDSAHGTNPASAVMAGFQVVSVKCNDGGNIDLSDLRDKLTQHSTSVAAMMVTYPSTHGVFEEEIVEICSLAHSHGAQVYMDGANLNAQVGLCQAGQFGVDVCHINLHKTFCIPHGGGGPGMGPICVKKHLIPFLPGTPGVDRSSSKQLQPTGPVSAAEYGSASILLIPWMYIRMMGAEGLTHATKIAILNANYIAQKLDPYFPVLYRGARKRVAHECILDLRWAKAHGIEVEDVAKRLMDYGFHAPTVSFPVAGTLMVEPTESESLAELDRFCDAMKLIHKEIMAVKNGEYSAAQSPLKNAPHTAEFVTAEEWNLPYSRELAAYPAAWTKEHKFWPAVRRIDNVYGDRNLFCTCS